MMTRIDGTAPPRDYSESDAEPRASRPGAVAGGDLMSELAALMVENDALRAALDGQRVHAARIAQERAMREEVRALEEAADHAVVQAWVQGGITVAGSGLAAFASFSQAANSKPEADASGGTDAGAQADYESATLKNQGLGQAGAGLGGLAQPIGELAGGIGKRRAETDAREAAHRVTRAGADAEEARAHRAEVVRHTDSVLGLVENIRETEHQGNIAILSRF